MKMQYKLAYPKEAIQTKKGSADMKSADPAQYLKRNTMSISNPQ